MAFQLVISPYDLTARSAAAVAACVLADRVVTLMPGPGVNLPRDPAALARRGTPAFERLAEAWAWSGPLWRGGCLVAGMDGDAVADAVRAARAGIDRSPDMSVLASLLRRTDVAPGDDDDAETDHGQGAAADGVKFDAICRDLVTGGINPSVTVPLNAAVESFASQAGMAIVRGESGSLTGRIEKSAQRVVFRLSCLCLTEADASDMVAVRGATAESARGFRAAMTDLVAAVRGGERQAVIAAAVGAADAERVAFEVALEERVGALRKTASFSGQRMKLARVTISGALAEAGAGVRAARAAAAILEPGSGMRIGSGAVPPSARGDVQDHATGALNRGPMVVLGLKPLGLNIRGGGLRLEA